MTNNSDSSHTLNAGESYNIPVGYHSGLSVITANSLSSQTAGTASAGHILSGKTAWVGGTQLTGTLAVQNISSVTAATQSSSAIRISWKNPASGPYTGVKIFMSTSGNPGTGGTAKYTGTGSSTTASGTSYVDITGLSASTKYYFTVCAYVTNVGNGTSYNVNATTSAPKGSQTFTSSGTFTVPSGVTSIDIFCVGGGGAGGGIYCKDDPNYFATGGAGGGYTSTKKGYAVTPGASFTVTIGAGGIAQKPTNSTQHSSLISHGSATSFGSVVSAAGGNGTTGGYGGISASGGAGGSGGGGSGNVPNYPITGSGGAGGSNGGNGTAGDKMYKSDGVYMRGKYTNGGTGQGTTTRAFGETSGTLYAGGGGGPSYTCAAGGSGGGGAAGNAGSATSGSANTGGGGGGTGANYSRGSSYIGSSGGSGICLVRWGY